MKRKLYLILFYATLIVSSGLYIYSENYNFNRDKWLEIYDGTIKELIEAKKFEDAIIKGELALATAQTEFGEDDLLCAIANVRIAEAKLFLSHRQDALQYLLRASEIYSKYDGSRIMNINIYEKIGDIHCELGNVSIGREFYKKALQMMSDWQLNQEDKEALKSKIDNIS